jgi:heterotetrameric sarcosine oxidase gamma subunit
MQQREKGTIISINSQLQRLSPLHEIHRRSGAKFEIRVGWQIPHVYTSVQAETEALCQGVGLIDVSPNGKLLIKGNKVGELLAPVVVAPRAPGHTSVFSMNEKTLQIAHLAADEFLLLTPPGLEEAVALQVETLQVSRRANPASEFMTFIDQTSGLAGMMVGGPSSHKLLRKLCQLPLTEVAFPAGRVIQSTLAGVHAIILRDNRDDRQVFALYVARPDAAYLWEALLDAGGEFGTIPCGWAAKAAWEGQGLQNATPLGGV